jgi:hypothetical protein
MKPAKVTIIVKMISEMEIESNLTKIRTHNLHPLTSSDFLAVQFHNVGRR